jgi:hypothetical protein
VAKTIDRSTAFSSRCFVIENTWNPSTNGSSFGDVKTITRTRTGNTNPGYKKVIASGGNATTDLTGTYQRIMDTAPYYQRVTINNPDGSFRLRVEARGDFASFFGSMPTYGFPASKAGSRAAAKFLAAVRSVEVKMSGPTFLGEARETLRMLRKPAAGLQDAVKAYADRLRNHKRQSSARGHDWKKDIGNLWLEHSFGWIPLIRDIEDARAAFNSLIDKDPRVVRISVGDRDVINSTPTPTSSDFAGTPSYMSVLHTYARQDEQIVRYRGAVRAQSTTTARDRLARFGFTPSEFVPTAWELLPWSFLADYFVNIGELVSASVTDTSRVSWVSQSVIGKATVKVTSSFNFAALGGFWKYAGSFSPGYATFQHRTVTRTANVNVPYPTLRFYYPGSNMRLLNIAALLSQVSSSVHPQSPSKRNFR